MARNLSLTYGQLPTVKQFNDAWRAALGVEDYYNYALNSSDARVAARYGVAPEGPVRPKELYSMLQGLVNGFEEDSDDAAGDLASSFLQSIGIEWI